MATLTPTQDLATWVSELRYEHLPAEVVQTVRKCLLDAIGCGLYGRDQACATIIADWLLAGDVTPGLTGAASAWGDSLPRLRTQDAALLNGVAAHSFELDDFHNAKLHPGAAIIPAAVAVAESIGAGGRELLTAIAAGYEVMIRTSKALNPTVARLRGWHLTGVCGPLGAAAAAASLYSLNRLQTAWALGLGGTQGSGLWAFNADGAMSKRFHAGRAAQSGVIAAELAARGFSGPTRLYEAPDGSFLNAFSTDSSAEVLTHNLGNEFHLVTIGNKPYPSCASTHAYIDAAMQLRERLGARVSLMNEMRIGCTKVVDIQCGFQYVPETSVTAQMSAKYCIALTLLHGIPGPAHFHAPYLDDPAIVRLAQSIEVQHSSELEALFPDHLGGWIEAQVEGECVRADISDPVGSQGNPMGWNQIATKFRSLLVGRGDGNSVGRLEALVADVENTNGKQLISAMRGMAADTPAFSKDLYKVAV